MSIAIYLWYHIGVKIYICGSIILYADDVTHSLYRPMLHNLLNQNKYLYV